MREFKQKLVLSKQTSTTINGMNHDFILNVYLNAKGLICHASSDKVATLVITNREDMGDNPLGLDPKTIETNAHDLAFMTEKELINSLYEFDESRLKNEC